MVWKFIKEVLSCFYPPKYKSLKSRKFWQSYGFVLKVLLIAFVISTIIMIPDMLKLKNEITEEIGKMHSVNISGKIETTSPVRIPVKDPLLVRNGLFSINFNNCGFALYSLCCPIPQKYDSPLTNKYGADIYIKYYII